MTSRRARQRQSARPWQQQPDNDPPPIDWAALAQDRERQQQQPQKETK